MDSLIWLQVEHQRWALPLACVREVLRGLLPVPVPRAPFGCLGAVDIRGQLRPLLDLGAVLATRRPLRGDLLEARLLSSHVVLVDLPGCPLALLVDRVLAVDASDATDSARVAAAPLEGVLGVALEADQQPAPLLDLSGLIAGGRRKLLRDAVSLRSSAG